MLLLIIITASVPSWDVWKNKLNSNRKMSSLSSLDAVLFLFYLPRALSNVSVGI